MIIVSTHTRLGPDIVGQRSQDYNFYRNREFLEREGDRDDDTFDILS